MKKDKQLIEEYAEKQRAKIKAFMDKLYVTRSADMIDRLGDTRLIEDLISGLWFIYNYGEVFSGKELELVLVSNDLTEWNESPTKEELMDACNLTESEYIALVKCIQMIEPLDFDGLPPFRVEPNEFDHHNLN